MWVLAALLFFTVAALFLMAFALGLLYGFALGLLCGFALARFCELRHHVIERDSKASDFVLTAVVGPEVEISSLAHRSCDQFEPLKRSHDVTVCHEDKEDAEPC